MKTGSLVLATLLLIGGASAIFPAHAGSDTSLLNRGNPDYEEVVVAETLQSPLWWNQVEGSDGVGDDEAVWVIVQRPQGPFTIRVESEGGVIAGFDAYQVHPTADYATPACAQDHVARLFMKNGESVFGYTTRLLQITTVEHQTTVPGTNNLRGAVSMSVIPPSSSEVYLFAIDARAGTTLGVDGDVSYSITSDNAAQQFAFLYVAPPTLPPGANVFTWTNNLDRCDGIPLPPANVPNAGSASELPDVGTAPVNLSDLFGTSL